MVDYTGLSQRLGERGLSRTAFAKLLGISSRTMAKIGRGESVSGRVINRMAAYLGCRADDLCRTISDNALLQALRDEKEAHISGGIYHELQVRMTFNSNHIEGSRLTEDQTRMIFEIRTIDATGGIPVDDVLETVGHFRAIDFCIDKAEEPLTEDLVKQLHHILKWGTHDSHLGWFAVGDYKTRPNVVGGRTTCAPKIGRASCRERV